MWLSNGEIIANDGLLRIWKEIVRSLKVLTLLEGTRQRGKPSSRKEIQLWRSVPGMQVSIELYCYTKVLGLNLRVLLRGLKLDFELTPEEGLRSSGAILCALWGEDSTCNSPGLYSENDGFESHFGYRPNCRRLFAVFLIPCRQISW
jgi:hypothetical protein